MSGVLLALWYLKEKTHGLSYQTHLGELYMYIHIHIYIYSFKDFLSISYIYIYKSSFSPKISGHFDGWIFFQDSNTCFFSHHSSRSNFPQDKFYISFQTASAARYLEHIKCHKCCVGSYKSTNHEACNSARTPLTKQQVVPIFWRRKKTQRKVTTYPNCRPSCYPE